MTSFLLDALFQWSWVAEGPGRRRQAFLLQAAHVAGARTNVAAHPVVASGKGVPDEEMKRKITNDLAAHMRSLAQVRGRNAEKLLKNGYRKFISYRL